MLVKPLRHFEDGGCRFGQMRKDKGPETGPMRHPVKKAALNIRRAALFSAFQDQGADAAGFGLLFLEFTMQIALRLIQAQRNQRTSFVAYLQASRAVIFKIIPQPEPY